MTSHTDTVPRSVLPVQCLRSNYTDTVGGMRMENVCHSLALVLVTYAITGVLPQETCRTHQVEQDIVSNIDIQHNGNTIAADCLARIVVNKCEGTCLSHVSPSVVVFPGLRKVCKCCREARLVDLSVTFTRCFSGSTLIPNVSPTTTLRHPTGCTCRTCAN